MAKKIIIFLLLILSLTLFSKDIQKQRNFITFQDVFNLIQKGDKIVLKEMTYSGLMNFSDFIRIKALNKKTTFVNILWSNNKKLQKNVVKATAGGLFNRDPRVRLYCIHLLMKLSPKRKWFEKDVQRALDPMGEQRETVDSYYEYTDIYGIYKSERVKNALTKLLEVGPRIILIKPEYNLSTYQNSSFTFEWSTVYGGVSYDLYIGNILYYSGDKTLIFVRRKLPLGPHRWQVIAKDFYGNIITSTEALLYIKTLAKPVLEVARGFLYNRPKFRWEPVRGVDYYELYRYVENVKDHKGKRLYKGEKTYFATKEDLEEKNYSFYLVARNVFQRNISDKLILKVKSEKGQGKTEIEKPLTKEDKARIEKQKQEELDFDIEDFKDIEEENKAELEEEEKEEE